MNFMIDGHQISATFADAGDTAVVLDRVKQILLSAFADHIPQKCTDDTLAIQNCLSDNIDGGCPGVP
jgi:hypothetical protein